jgi:hypothetical protein
MGWYLRGKCLSKAVEEAELKKEDVEKTQSNKLIAFDGVYIQGS